MAAAPRARFDTTVTVGPMWRVLQALHGENRRLTTPARLARARAAHQRLRPLRPRRRARQPRHQPDGALPQPGHARAGRLLAADVPPVVGADADPGEPAGAHDAPR